jgi:hypothetical protein
MRLMMKAHLHQALEAEDRLAWNYAADIRDYEASRRRCLEMAED